jgi:hypothetical protein
MFVGSQSGHKPHVRSRIRSLGGRLRLTAIVAAMAAVPLADGGLQTAAAAQQTDYVVAHSRHGNGSVEGPVRPVRNGWQVRLPGGTWVSCRRSCAETLRVQSIDLFETDGRLIGYGDVQNQCGLFGCIDLNLFRH